MLRKKRHARELRLSRSQQLIKNIRPVKSALFAATKKKTSQQNACAHDQRSVSH